MSSYKLAPNKAYPSIPTVSGSLENHTLVLEAIREALEIHERRTGNAGDSFVRLHELEDLGVVTIDQTTQIVVVPDDDGVFIRRDGTSPATTGEIDIGAGLLVEGGDLTVEAGDIKLTTGAVSIQWDDVTYAEVGASLVGGTPDPDPNFGSVTLLASFDNNTAGDEAFTPEIGPAFEWWNNGFGTQPTDYDGEISTAQAINGSQSLYGKEVSGAASAGWQTTAPLTTEQYDFSGDFTIETHIYPVAWSSNMDMLSMWDFGKYQWRFFVDAAGKINFIFSTNGTTSTNVFSQRTFNGGETIQAGQWYHITICRSGTSWYGYVNGTPLDNTMPMTNANTIFSATEPYLCMMQVGQNDGAANVEFYLDNVRITDGVARYTAPFTAPTAPYQGTGGVTTTIFTVGDVGAKMQLDATYVNLNAGIGIDWGNVEFLVLAEDGVIGGEGGDPFWDSVLLLCLADDQLTAGNATWDDQSQYGHVMSHGSIAYADDGTLYSPARNSGLFMYHTGDNNRRSEVPYHADFDFGTGDFTVDFYMRHKATNVNSFIAGNWSGSTGYSFWLASSSGGGVIHMNVDGVNYSFTGANWYSYVTTGEWGHVGIEREGDTARLYINGVLRATQTGLAAVDFQSYGQNFTVGARGPGSSANYHDLDDFRVTTAARYGGTGFTPSTDPTPTQVGGAGFLVGDPNYGTQLDGNLIVLNGPVNALSTIAVTGAATFASTVAVTGAVTFESTLAVTGATTLTGTLTANGVVDVNAAATLSGGVTVDTADLTLDAVDLVIDAGTNTLTISSDDTDAALTSVGLTDLDVVGFTAVNFEEATGLEWGDVTFIDHAEGAAGSSDSLFHYVVLLADFDGSDAATSFTEESGYGRSLTFFGDAQLDTAQFKFGTSSLLLDGGGDYVTLPDSSDWDFGTGDFTIECHVRLNATGVYSLISNYLNGSTGFALQFRSDTGIFGFTWGNSTLVSHSVGQTTGQWYHLAVSREGTNLRLFMDGVLVASTTNSTNLTGSTATLKIGSLNGSVQLLNGWLDNVRITKGAARYTAAFTPPTAAFPTEGHDSNYTNDVLLVDFDGSDAATTATDESPSAHTLTFNGNAQLDTAQVFAGSASLLLDGTGDNVTAPHHADWDFAGGDWTVEANVRFNTVGHMTIVSHFGSSGSFGWTLEQVSASQLRFMWSVNGTSVFTNTVSFTPNTGQWYHIAAARDGQHIRVFVDGALLGTNSTVAGVVFNNPSIVLGIGGRASNNIYLDGWIDNVRVTKGVARYTAAFTPPVVHATQASSPVTPDTFTVGHADHDTDVLGDTVTVDATAVVVNSPTEVTDSMKAVHYREVSSSPTITSGALTIDVTSGGACEVTLTENVTAITLTNPPASEHVSVTVKFVQDGTGGRTVTGWPASVKWPGGSAPVITTTATTGADLVYLESWDGGTTWYGHYDQNFS